MADNIATYLIGWDVLRAFSLAWLVLTFIFTSLLLPTWFLSGIILISTTSLLCASLGVLKGRWAWAVAALLADGALFASALISSATSNQVVVNFPDLLFVFVMILFEVEVLQLLSQRYELFSAARRNSDFGQAALILRRSLKEVGRGLARFGVIFGACYALTICVVYAGSILASYVPFPSDISLYIVAASVALALIVVLREEQ
jgi:hypothetical protein